MKMSRYFLPVILLTLLFLVACGNAIDSEEPGPVMVQGGEGVVPAEYADLQNPLEDDPQAIERGDQAYNALCVQCHGEQGAGDGTEAAGMQPHPGDFSDANHMSTLSDGYMFWRISDGGGFDPYNSLMPAWGTLLSETEIWELVSFIRTLPE
jgi:mono/diheme cytochrome c family protein